MIYLTTGANGSFKTCNTLWDVRQQQLKENRPVFYHGFEPLAPIHEFGWKPFDPKRWQDLPDGSICIMDECQNEFPLRRSGSDVPDYVNAIAQFRRKRGFDFWMITPHPMLLDVFIRRLVDNPSWHRHNKRVAGSSLISQAKWSAVRVDCEKPGAGDSGEVSMVPARKEVFEWYTSASMHTGKVKLPRAVWVFAACVLVVPLLGYLAFDKVMNPGTSASRKAADVKVAAAAAGGAPVRPAPVGTAAVQTVAEYAAARVPRIPGFPQTAPVYDALTTPAVFPYPAACIARGDRCDCFTQQGTAVATPGDVCRQIVRQGFFMEWAQAVRDGLPLQGSMSPASPPVLPSPGAAPVARSASSPMQLPPAAAAVTSTAADAAGAHDGGMLAAMRASPHAFKQEPFLAR